jgi:hypothetical protein
MAKDEDKPGSERPGLSNVRRLPIPGKDPAEGLREAFQPGQPHRRGDAQVLLARL